jgi:hypothetical protein
MYIKARSRDQALEKQTDATLQQLYAIDSQYKRAAKGCIHGCLYLVQFNQYKGFRQKFAQVDPQVIYELLKDIFNG